MRLAGLLLMLATLALLAVGLLWEADAIAQWAVTWQRAFQNQMAGAIAALRSGDPGAYAALLAAAGAYGFVHAVGPGHGKYLIGGVGLGTSVSATRLMGIAAVSSLAQSLWAIALVYGGFTLLELSAQRMTVLAEEILAPMSFLAIAAVGLVLVWRGLASLSQQLHPVPAQAHIDGHAHGECGCHAHGPSPGEVARLGSVREALILVGSIAIRPCTGAIFLLVIAWQMEFATAGAAAVIVMGLGTALLTSLVAVSSTAARGITWAGAQEAGAVALALPTLQAVSGIVIVWISFLLLGAPGL